MCDNEPGGSRESTVLAVAESKVEDCVLAVFESKPRSNRPDSLNRFEVSSDESDSECFDPSSSSNDVFHTSGWLGSARRAGEKVFSKIRTENGTSNKERTSLRNRLMTAWNNMKYSGKLMTDHSNQYSAEVLIVLLGEVYAPDGKDFTEFFIDYYSRIWLTYRIGFEAFTGTKIISDCGWGCMLRTSQMMVAQAIIVNRFGRDWRWRRFSSDCDGGQIPILELFEDKVGSPLGIHRIMQIASELHGKKVVGRWFTPSESLGLLSRAIRTSCSPLTSDLATVVSVDGRVILHAIERETRHWTRTLLLFICVRLGAHTLNRDYVHHLKYLFSMPNCLGIAGGKPNRSLYFVGFYDEQLIYLDPHVAHPYISLRSGSQNGETQISTETLGMQQNVYKKQHHSPLSSYHCKLLSKMHILDIDPSCAIGLLLRNREEFDKTMQRLNLHQVIDVELGLNLGSKKTRDPLFTVLHDEPKDYEEPQTDEREREQAREQGFELL